MRTRRMLLSLLLLPALASCSDSKGVASSKRATLVVVDPEEFRGNVPCASTPGSMQAYVATLEDVTGELGAGGSGPDSFVLPSSPPVPCTRPVAFGFVVPEHRYVADIEAYGRSQLEPLAPGSPIMLDPDTGSVLKPAWTTSCGRQQEGAPNPVVVREHVSVKVRACSPLLDHRATTVATSISVDITDALGTLDCGDEDGEVSSFSVTMQAGGSGPKVAPCGSAVSFDGLEADASHAFIVAAFAADSATPDWGTTCYQVARLGTTTPAMCDPLSASGGARVDIPNLLADAKQHCGVNAVVRVEATLNVDGVVVEKSQMFPECQSALQFDRLAPGSYQLDIRTWTSDGAEGPAATCTVAVTPGAVAVAECQPIAG